MSLLFWLSLLSFGLTLSATFEIALGMRRLVRLRDVPPAGDGELPKVSIVIPACNEADTIGPALQSVLGLAYPDLEVLVVNDRSTDGTGDVLRHMRQRYPRLKVIEITELPAGWMGKAHALQEGARQATGAYLLFTDADILLEKTTLSRAMAHVLRNRLDHLSLFFKNIGGGGLLNTLMLDVGGGLLLLFKPWKAKEKNSKHFMGVGAFNLVRAEAYRAIGGHRSFAMHPVDDIVLGKVLKRKGFSQECLLGDDFVRVEWYATIRELIRGVMKNTFAVYDFSISWLALGCLLVLVMGIVPAWGLLVATGAARALFAGSVAIRLFFFALGLRLAGVPPGNALWSLVTPFLSIYIAVKAAVVTLRNDGITWRGTHYSLDEMRKGERLLWVRGWSRSTPNRAI
ncbi:MAG: glycosyltransferase [Desulfobacteraceae bacterium]|nr:glycosyltransferase [Desulfobacteraceae bacterium]